MNDYRYDYAWFQPTSSFAEFKVRTCNDGHILLATSLFDETKGYEIVLGGYDNSRSDIRRGSHGQVLQQADTPDIMNCDEFLPFWIRWGNKSVIVGSGRLDDHIVMRFDDPEQPEIKALSVTSWVTASAEYHFPEIDGEFSQQFVSMAVRYLSFRFLGLAVLTSAVTALEHEKKLLV
jgi:hypothetical protein